MLDIEKIQTITTMLKSGIDSLYAGWWSSNNWSYHCADLKTSIGDFEKKELDAYGKDEEESESGIDEALLKINKNLKALVVKARGILKLDSACTLLRLAVDEYYDAILEDNNTLQTEINEMKRNTKSSKILKTEHEELKDQYSQLSGVYNQKSKSLRSMRRRHKLLNSHMDSYRTIMGHIGDKATTPDPTKKSELLGEVVDTVKRLEAKLIEFKDETSSDEDAIVRSSRIKLLPDADGLESDHKGESDDEATIAARAKKAAATKAIPVVSGVASSSIAPGASKKPPAKRV